MSTPTISPDPNVRLNSYEIQARKAQDFVITGLSSGRGLHEQEFHWIVVADGHGDNTVINYLRSLDWGMFLHDPDFYSTLCAGIKQLGDTFSSGSTLSVVKIYTDYADCYWVGDSQIRIYKSLENIFESKNHDDENNEELERLKQPPGSSKTAPLVTPYRKPGWRPSAISTSSTLPNAQGRITMRPSTYVIFYNNTINMTNSLGHNGITGKFISHARISLKPGFDYKIIVATDGLYDMVCWEDYIYLAHRDVDSMAIAKVAAERWQQIWEYLNPNITLVNQVGEETQFPPTNTDDIAVAVWYRGV